MDLAETTEGNGSVDFRHNGLTHRKVERQIIQRIRNGHRNDQISKDWKPIQVMKLFKSKPPTSDLRAAEEAVLKGLIKTNEIINEVNQERDHSIVSKSNSSTNASTNKVAREETKLATRQPLKPCKIGVTNVTRYPWESTKSNLSFGKHIGNYPEQNEKFYKALRM